MEGKEGKRKVFSSVMYVLAAVAGIAFIAYLNKGSEGVAEPRGENYAMDDKTLERGAALFNQNCAACHAVQNDAIGPCLGGVTTLIPKEAPVAFIQNPASAGESGDERAAYLFARCKAMMPSFEYLSLAQLSVLLSYIRRQSELLHLPLMKVNASSLPVSGGQLVSPVKSVGLKIELEEFIKIPRSVDRPSDKERFQRHISMIAGLHKILNWR